MLVWPFSLIVFELPLIVPRAMLSTLPVVGSPLPPGGVQWGFMVTFEFSLSLGHGTS